MPLMVILEGYKLQFWIGVIAILSLCSHQVWALQPPTYIGTAVIDYSAVNEYVQHHYATGGESTYFPHQKNEEPVYDARQGVVKKQGQLKKATLDTDGFKLVKSPTKVSNWTNRQQLQDIYLPELRGILEREFGAENITQMHFFHPMMRGEDFSLSSTTNTQQSTDGVQTSPTAAMAHIDNDIGAFEAERVVGLVETNWLPDNEDGYYEFPRQEILEAIERRHRFLIINCWRNIAASPIQRSPLGILATQYCESGDNSLSAFPMAQPDFGYSRWYIYPKMTPDECLLFKQYDRDSRYVSDLWHCALDLVQVGADTNGPFRRSLDVRAFVLLQQQTPATFDRYKADRMRPVVSYEESEQFCRAQGKCRASRKGG